MTKTQIILSLIIALSVAFSVQAVFATGTGRIVGWGEQATPNQKLSGLTSISAGGYHSLALKSDGTIVGWGWNYYGQASSPSGSDFIAIAAGRDHSIALKSDGTIVGWGANYYGESSPPSGTDFVAIAAGVFHSLAIHTVTVVPPVEMPMNFTPGALNPASQGNWLKAHFVLPDGYEISDIDVNTPAVLEPLGIESEYITVFEEGGRLAESGVEIGFARSGLCDVLGDFGPAEVTVSARLTSGQYFYGTDTLKVIANDFKSLSVVASYWLANGCTSPNWCGGADVDASGTVDLTDFVLFDSCCLEVF
jgi:hypothetical protein